MSVSQADVVEYIKNLKSSKSRTSSRSLRTPSASKLPPRSHGRRWWGGAARTG